MIFRKIVCFIIIFHFAYFYGYSQGENNVWTFGNGSGLNFNTANPTFLNSSMYSKEGCASISDAFGNLIFYTSGNMVWDKNGNPMPNGNILGNGYNGSGTQAALILKSLSAPDQYYLFTLDPQEVSITFTPKLRYSIVDMQLNNGLGNVVVSEKDIVLADEMEERMIAVETDGCGYWIVGHKRHSKVYVSFKLTASGISPPVYSTGNVAGYFYASDPGEIKISPDKSKIAIMFTSTSSIELGEFNNANGTITNTLSLDSNTTGTGYYGYGLSFSPDNSRLYATINGYSQLYQYNMALYPNVAAMQSSKTLIADYNGGLAIWGMRIGRDGKVYLANGLSSGYISCINTPNNIGVGCNYDPQSVQVPPSNYFNSLIDPFYGFGLGNETVTVTYKDTLPGRYIDTLICFSDSAQLRVPSNLLNYTWNDGVTGAARYVHDDGIYCCLSTKECSMRMDTFKVTFVKGNLELGPDTSICPGDSILLSVSGSGFRWQDGSTDSLYMVNQNGTYSVRINQDGCFYADTIQVMVYNTEANIVEDDQLLCEGDQVALHGQSVPDGTLTWSNGANGDVTTVNTSGQYVLSAETACGTLTDSVKVWVQDCDCQPGTPNAFSPNGDGLNDSYKAVLNCFTKNYMLSVYNRYGQRIFSAADQERGWDGNYNGAAVDAGTYFYHLRYETPNGQEVQRKGDITLIR